MIVKPIGGGKSTVESRRIDGRREIVRTSTDGARKTVTNRAGGAMMSMIETAVHLPGTARGLAERGCVTAVEPNGGHGRAVSTAAGVTKAPSTAVIGNN